MKGANSNALMIEIIEIQKYKFDLFTFNSINAITKPHSGALIPTISSNSSSIELII